MKTAREIISDIADKHGITYEQIVSHARKRKYAWPRQEAMYECYYSLGHISMPGLARIMGGRDHTTILHGIRQHAYRNKLPLHEKNPGRAQLKTRTYTPRTDIAALSLRYEKVMKEARA